MAGGMLGPIMVEPFLLKIPHNSGLNVTNMNNTLSQNSSAIMEEDSQVMYGYMIGGVILLCVCLLYFAVYISFGGIYIENTQQNKQNNNSTKTVKGLKGLIIVCLCIFYVFHSVFLRSYSNYILTFTVNHMGWTKTQGANLTSVYFAAAMIFKIMIIYIVRVVKFEILVFVGLIMSNIASISMLLFVDLHDSIIWVFTVLISCGTTTTYAVLLAWTDKYIGIKGYIGVMYSIAGSVGEMLFSAVIGYLFQNVSYYSYMYLLVSSTGICFVIMVMLQFIALRYKQYENVIVERDVNESDPLLAKNKD